MCVCVIIYGHTWPYLAIPAPLSNSRFVFIYIYIYLCGSDLSFFGPVSVSRAMTSSKKHYISCIFLNKTESNIQFSFPTFFNTPKLK